MPERSPHIALPILTALVIVGMLISGVWWYKQLARSRSSTQLDSAVRAALQGDSITAAKRAEEYLQNTDTRDPYYLQMMAVRAISLADTATTTAQMIEAVRAIKESFNAATSDPSARASAVNTLIAALYDFKNRAANAEAYKDEPFKSLRISDDVSASLKNMAAYSVSIYPTADAYLYLARADANLILDALATPGSDKKSLGENVAGIIDAVQKADALLSANKPNRSSFYNSYPWQLYWKAYDMGAAARADARYLPQAEDAFKDAVAYFEMTKDPAGNTVPAIEMMGTDARLSYAVTLYRVSGHEHASDIRENLRQFLQNIQANPSRYQGYFNFFNAARTATASGTTTAQRRAYASHLLYSRLAELSPELRTFLVFNGWNI